LGASRWLRFDRQGIRDPRRRADLRERREATRAAPHSTRQSARPRSLEGWTRRRASVEKAVRRRQMDDPTPLATAATMADQESRELVGKPHLDHTLPSRRRSTCRRHDRQRPCSVTSTNPCSPRGASIHLDTSASQTSAATCGQFRLENLGTFLHYAPGSLGSYPYWFTVPSRGAPLPHCRVLAGEQRFGGAELLQAQASVSGERRFGQCRATPSASV
jgi:hypothetical protein